MNRVEQSTQIAVVDFLRIALPRDVIFFAVPNGGYRTRAEAALTKAMGGLAGVPDLAFILPPNGTAAFIEMKSATGTLSPNQRAFRDRANVAGACWAECRSLADVIATLKLWGVKLRATVNV